MLYVFIIQCMCYDIQICSSPACQIPSSISMYRQFHFALNTEIISVLRMSTSAAFTLHAIRAACSKRNEINCMHTCHISQQGWSLVDKTMALHDYGSFYKYPSLASLSAALLPTVLHTREQHSGASQLDRLQVLTLLWSPIAGSGSILESLTLGKPLVVAINEQLMDNHQIELAHQLAQDNHLVYTTCRLVSRALDVTSQTTSHTSQHACDL